jgi:hypothetical protein
MKNKFLWFKVIVPTVLGLSLIGCGSSSSTNEDLTYLDSSNEHYLNTNSRTNTGTFIDSPVEGLKYETVTLSGFTDNKGNFQYKDGETITFKIGNLELGSATGGELITPLTLTGENDLNNINSKATNIARILQSLDENSSNQGQIKLSSNLKDLKVSNINLESEADLNAILQEAQNLTTQNYILKDSITAQNEMKSYINIFNNYQPLENKEYSGEGTKYYRLTLETKRNIDFSFSRYAENSASLTTVSLYDKNLIELKSSVRGIINLDAGTYIVKLSIKDSSFYHHTEIAYINVYLNNLIFENLEELKTQKYIGDGASFYKLDIKESKKINFTNYASKITIYDSNLNDLNYSIAGALVGDLSDIEGETLIDIPKGKYIIKIEISHTYYNYTNKNGYSDVSIF